LNKGPVVSLVKKNKGPVYKTSKYGRSNIICYCTKLIVVLRYKNSSTFTSGYDSGLMHHISKQEQTANRPSNKATAHILTYFIACRKKYIVAVNMNDE